MNNQEKLYAYSTVFVGFYTFLEKESESKTHAEKNNFKVCMLENQAFKNGDQINYLRGLSG
jgi:hypothetical protein